MSASLSRALDRALSTSWCPHRPHPKQAEFLALDCREALYGGAAGGGKSDALLMAALQHVDKSGYNAAIFRKTYSDLALPGAIMDRAHSWLASTKAHWDGVRKQWRFPSGARISFGYLQTANDRYRYQGAEFQFIAFDELTQFDSRDYLYLFSRLRAPNGLAVPLRMRAASNPGGLGHDWVHERFVAGADPQRRFVPALMSDNPSLDSVQYRASLSELDSITRRQLEDGVWEQDPTGLVYRVTPRNVLKLPLARVGSWTYMVAHDYGIVDSNAIALAAWEQHSDVVHILRSFYVRGMADDVAREHKALCSNYEVGRTIGDIGGLGKAFAAELMYRHNVPIQQAQKADKLGHIKLFNGALERGKILFHAEGCADLLAEYPKLVRMRNGNEATGVPNHCADATLYAWRECRAYMTTPKKQQPTDAERMARMEAEALAELRGDVDAWED